MNSLGVKTASLKKMPESVPAAHSMDPDEVDLSSLFWNVNIAQKRWAREPPPYLANMSEKDQGICPLEIATSNIRAGMQPGTSFVRPRLPMLIVEDRDEGSHLVEL